MGGSESKADVAVPLANNNNNSRESQGGGAAVATSAAAGSSSCGHPQQQGEPNVGGVGSSNSNGGGCSVITPQMDPNAPLGGCTDATKKKAGIGHPYSGDIALTGKALAGDPVTCKNIPFLGLDNFGNTCYINSVLQLLMQNPPFRYRLLAIYDKFYSSIVEPKPRPVDESVLSRLCELCHHIHTSKKKKGSVGPKDFIAKVKKDNIMFRNSHQQDAHEFMMYVLNDIIESEKTLLGYATTDPGLTSPLQLMISGQTVTETVCLECETRTTRAEPFLALPVDVEANRSLTQCVELFSEPEWMQGDDKFKCLPCSSKNIAKRSLKLLEPPPVLFIHMKRFKFVESSNSFKKLAYRIPLADDLGIRFLKYGATLNRQHYLDQMSEIRERAESLQGSTGFQGDRAEAVKKKRAQEKQQQQQQQAVATAVLNGEKVLNEGQQGQRVGGGCVEYDDDDDGLGSRTPRFSALVPPQICQHQHSGGGATTSSSSHQYYQQQHHSNSATCQTDDDDVAGLVLDLRIGQRAKHVPTPQNPYKQQQHPRPSPSKASPPQHQGQGSASQLPPMTITTGGVSVGVGAAGGGGASVGATLGGPEDLVPPLTHYRLCGFVVHQGAGLNLGHYFTVHRTEYGGGTWRRFDCETVSTLSDRDVELFFGYAHSSDSSSTATAYILSYVREDLLTV